MPLLLRQTPTDLGRGEMFRVFRTPVAVMFALGAAAVAGTPEVWMHKKGEGGLTKKRM